MSEYCDDKNFEVGENHAVDEVVVVEHESITVKGRRSASIGPKSMIRSYLHNNFIKTE